MTKIRLVSCLAFLVTLGRAEAHAATESSDSPTPQVTKNSSKLEEVIVTAQRRNESLQKVPVAVTAVNQQVLEENNVNSLSDLSYLVPSLAPLGGKTRDVQTPTIRGQGLNNSSIPGVISYLNEVPAAIDRLGQGASGAGLYYDLENIQVLKGPQGTLFGKNAIGGAILYETKRPTNDFGGYLKIGSGNYNNREFTGVLNLPMMDDKVLIRFAANGQKRDGYTKLYIYPTMRRGRNLDNQDYIAGRMSITFKPTDDFSNDLIVDYLDSHNDGSQLSLTTNDPAGFPSVFFPTQSEIFAAQQAAGPRAQVDTFDNYFSDRTSTSVANISRYEFSDHLALRNILGYSKASTNFAINFGPWIWIGPVPQHLEQYTEELQLQGNSFGGNLQWIFGVFYLDSPAPHDFQNQSAVLFGVPSNDVVGTKDSARSRAIFGQGTYDLSSWVAGLKVTAGLRYNWDDRFGAQRTLTFGECPPTAPAGVDEECALSGRSSTEALTWTANLEYQATPETLIYLASRRGYRTGGFSPEGGDPSHSTFKPEYVTDQELGVKSDWQLAGRPLRTNIAVYNQDYTDVQVQVLDFNHAPPVGFTGNAGAARIWGGEFEATIRATQSLQLGAIFSYINFRFTDFGEGVQPATIEAYKRTPNRGLPPVQFGLNGRYRLPVSTKMGEASIGANYSWVDATPNARPTTPGGDFKSYGLLNLSADWNHIAGGPISTSLYVTNATNKLQNVAGTFFSLYPIGLGYSLGTYNQPRMYGLNLRYDFGGR